MKTIKFYLFALSVITLCTLCLSLQTNAQGGKAEPNRITFKRGASNAIVNDKIKGDIEAEYIFGANSKQKVTVSFVTTPKTILVVKVLDTSNAILVEKEVSDKLTFTIPENGDYFFSVKLKTPRKTNVNYKLTLNITK